MIPLTTYLLTYLLLLLGCLPHRDSYPNQAHEARTCMRGAWGLILGPAARGRSGWAGGLGACTSVLRGGEWGTRAPQSKKLLKIDFLSLCVREGFELKEGWWWWSVVTGTCIEYVGNLDVCRCNVEFLEYRVPISCFMTYDISIFDVYNCEDRCRLLCICT